MIEKLFKKTNLTKLSQSKTSNEKLSLALHKRIYNQNLFMRLCLIFVLLFLSTFLIGDLTERNQVYLGNVALGDSPIIASSQDEPLIDDIAPPEINILAPTGQSSTSAQKKESKYTVQAVLGARNQIVLASGIDSKITKFKLESGDQFKKNDVLIEYDCSVDQGRLNEAMSRQRVTEQQFLAYQKLSTLNSVSNIELVVARENNEQNKALISQIRAKLKSCRHIAPWDGRVKRKMASQYEYVQTGRVLMEIVSNQPLRAEFLVPSHWLRWLNINTPVDIYINETDRTYSAKIKNIYGEVDPVSQSVQIVAEIERYYEELLSGMSGRATFTEKTIEGDVSNGFLGIKLSKDEIK